MYGASLASLRDIEGAQHGQELEILALRRDDDELVPSLVGDERLEPVAPSLVADDFCFSAPRAFRPPPPPPPQSSSPPPAPPTGRFSFGRHLGAGGLEDLRQDGGELPCVGVVDGLDPNVRVRAAEIELADQANHPSNVSREVSDDEDVRRTVGGHVSVRCLESTQQLRHVGGACAAEAVNSRDEAITSRTSLAFDAEPDRRVHRVVGLDDFQVSSGGHNGHAVRREDAEEGLVCLP